MQGQHNPVHQFSRHSGFWIQCGAPPHCFAVQAHITSVEGDPACFGLTPGFVEEQRKVYRFPEQYEVYRTAVLAAAMRHGFVRARGHGPKVPTTFQYYGRSKAEDVTRAILWFCECVHMADCEWILLGNLAVGSSQCMTYGQFRARTERSDVLAGAMTVEPTEDQGAVDTRIQGFPTKNYAVREAEEDLR